MTPNVENPLQRIPIRADVFHKAAQMGILSTPGSIIEDRQYELTFNNISAATSNWDEILLHKKVFYTTKFKNKFIQKITFLQEHTNNFHNTNPAFEWNNQSRKTSLDLKQIFDNFTFITTYAPAIVYNRILICGESVEFNCSTDFIASLTTKQLSLFNNIKIRIREILKYVLIILSA